MISVPILTDQIGAVGRLWRRPRPHPRSGLRESLGLASECLLQNGPVLGLGGMPSPRRPLLEGLDEAIVQATNDELPHRILRLAIII
jgi:hypothetical protein